MLGNMEAGVGSPSVMEIAGVSIHVRHAGNGNPADGDGRGIDEGRIRPLSEAGTLNGNDVAGLRFGRAQAQQRCRGVMRPGRHRKCDQDRHQTERHKHGYQPGVPQ